MERKHLIAVGMALILLGSLSLLLVGAAGLARVNLGAILWRFWPLTITALGLGLVIPPFLVRGQRALGALFIPGMPVLTTGGLLLLASLSNSWGLWGWLWPMLVISLAMGFLFAAIWMRLIWLAIPAIIIGLNGMVLQFCAITHLWHWWSVLWVIEPLAVGLALLTVGAVQGITGLRLAGLVLCGLAATAFMLMLVVLGAWWPFGLVGPVSLLLIGLVVLGWGVLKALLVPRRLLE
jgi:hypothetical protein